MSSGGLRLLQHLHRSPLEPPRQLQPRTVGAQYLAPRFTANRGAAEYALSEGQHVLGEDRFTQACEEGRGLTLDDAVAYAARKGGGRKRPVTGWASLTPAELEVVRLVSEGLRNDTIARLTAYLLPGAYRRQATPGRMLARPPGPPP